MQFCHQRTTFLTLNLQFAYFVWSKMSVKGIIMFLLMNNTRLERKILRILEFENGFLPTYLPQCSPTQCVKKGSNFKTRMFFQLPCVVLILYLLQYRIVFSTFWMEPFIWVWKDLLVRMQKLLSQLGKLLASENGFRIHFFV